MGNSIFDDDDDGFSLSAGIEGTDAKKSLPAPVKPVTKSAPSRPEVNRNIGSPATGSRVAPVQPRPVTENTRPAPVTPRVPPAPVQKLTAKPSMPAPTMPASRKPLPVTPVTPTTSLPSIPPAVYVQPEETITENVLPSQPIRVEKEDISYTDQAEDSLHQNYLTPVDYEAERREEEREAEREAERREERRRERAREQERADRILRERKEREEERLRLEREERDSTPETVAPVKVLSRKEQAAAKREEEKAKREARKNKGKVKGEKPVSNFSGDRSKVLALRVIVFSFIAILAFAGLKATFLPPAQPTPNQVISTVKKGLGITKFPTENGYAFVLGFSEIYLTIQKDGVGERNKQLALYAPGNVIAEQGFTKGGTGNDTADSQVVTSGPYISGVTSKDDKNAIYTVSAEINNSQWVYIDVPVQYDVDNPAFVVSGAPSFVPAPHQAKLEAIKREWPTDDAEAVKEFKPDAKLFFEAWALSNTDVIKVHSTPDADTSTKSGLNGIVTLKTVSSISIQPAEGLADSSVRKARVVVVWDNSLSPGASYNQTYDLVIVKVPGEDHWKVRTINGGVPLESGS